MKEGIRIFSFAILGLSAVVSLSAQSENRVIRGQPRNVPNPKTTVIIDYVDSFEHHRPNHGGGPGGGGDEPPTDEPPTTHLEGHFELIGGVWDDSDATTTRTVSRIHIFEPS